ncbi:hypothetical protein LSH36_71g05098 [Paralvinella palmiformis]|uniref:SOCS box domain-containing protein n=1 Tax=Paralvinella palmiformis TaxID=53620 RepID=A0AAD9K3A3_9ANNE|nr:hypothetical protein LSH36_71g05098 [Paralvinella palmiformis]
MGDLEEQNERVVPRPLPDGVNQDEITQLHVTETLYNAGARADNTTWCPCAWSSDCMYLAHSSGRTGSEVVLVPWNRYKCCLVSTDAYTSDGHVLQLKERRFNAGEMICSLTFGSSVAETRPGSTQLDWSRYKYRQMQGLIIAAGTRSGQIRVWSIDEGADINPMILMDHQKLVSDLKFAPDGSLRLLSGSYDGSLKVWNLKDDGNMFPTLRGKDIDGNQYRKFYSISWSPNCKLVCGVGTASGVFVWNLETRKGSKFRFDGQEVRGHLHDVLSCDFSPDGALLVTSSRDTKILVWNPYTGDALRQLLHLHPPPTIAFAGGASNSYVRGVSFSHDGRHVASICDDGYLRVWDVFQADIPEALASIPEGLCCSYSPHGATLLVGSGDKKVHVLQAPMRVSTLRHYCRVALCRVFEHGNLTLLGIQPSLLHYLEYVDFDSEAIPPLKERMHHFKPLRQTYSEKPLNNGHM